MKILSIETSCDETAVSIVEASGNLAGSEKLPAFKVLSNLVLSQVKVHEKYGGVFPNLAKREHSKNLGPLLKKALHEAGLAVVLSEAGGGPKGEPNKLEPALHEKIKYELSREPELFASLLEIFETTTRPEIDLVAVTSGPGLEPALWVGINAAKVLGEVWDIPVMPVNHMEGHISSVLLGLNSPVEFPALALLISGGHTELVKIPDWLSYEVVGETRDDAVGEAFDKVARMLGLPYPGGPAISILAEQARYEARHKNEERQEKEPTQTFNFPRPMIKSGDLDFSFSGLKTSVLYTLHDLAKRTAASGVAQGISEETKKQIALGFEDAVIETLITKTKKAIEQYEPRTFIVAGGVIANKTLRAAFEKLTASYHDLKLLVPEHNLSTDNALMIALAAYVRFTKNPMPKSNLPGATLPGTTEIKAQGNLRLSK